MFDLELSELLSSPESDDLLEELPPFPSFEDEESFALLTVFCFGFSVNLPVEPSCPPVAVLLSLPCAVPDLTLRTGPAERVLRPT